MIMMPPGSAKSTYASVIFGAWLIAKGVPVIGASHTMSLAESFSGRVQNLVAEHEALLDCRLLTRSKERWLTTSGGEYRAAGVGGALTGFRAQIAIIDDPVKSRADADSETYRNTAWEWFSSSLLTRLKPDGGVVLIMTRWHEDDLAGRLLASQPGRWRVLSLPAIAEHADDALGRTIGEPLWADDGYGFAADLQSKRHDLETSGQSREWSALYQQRPRPLEGTLFKTANIHVLDVAPAGGTICRGWDLAATRAIGTRDPDYTCGVKLARMPNGAFVVLDVFRDRGGPDQVEGWINNISRADGRSVKISIPQDPGQAGKTQVLALTRMLSGFNITSSPETGDKATRASPVISQVNAGNFSVVRAPWNVQFLDELSAFPAGAKDDQVDALSRAFGIVGLGPKPMVFSPDTLAFLGRK